MKIELKIEASGIQIGGCDDLYALHDAGSLFKALS